VNLLVDDQLLSRVLRRDALPDRLDWTQPIFTTGYWYVRLCQAVLGAATRPGVLSTPFMALTDARRDQALATLTELPDEIGLLSLRTLGPTIGRLRLDHQLNILSLEALAAAIHLQATVVLSTRSPRLEEALAAEGRHFELVV